MSGSVTVDIRLTWTSEAAATSDEEPVGPLAAGQHLQVRADGGAPPIRELPGEILKREFRVLA